MSSEIHRALNKKRNASPNDFTSPITLRARIEPYITQFSPGYWRSLTREGMRTKIGSQKILRELQFRAKCGRLCEISKAGRSRIRSFTAVLKRKDKSN